MKLKLQHIIEAFPQMEGDLTKLKKFNEEVPTTSLAFFPNEKLLKELRDYMKAYANLFKKLGWKTNYQVETTNQSIKGDTYLYGKNNSYAAFDIAFRYHFRSCAYDDNPKPDMTVFDSQDDETHSKEFHFHDHKAIINYILIERGAK